MPAEKKITRKLRAILSADVKGYSRMMGEDEDGTYQTLTANLESIRFIISEHNGQVFSSPGDAVMAQFASVVDAVKCAVELQETIEAANVGVPEDRKMQFRIGVNLGDVIHDGEQVYGDGVNIAARIETLAEPGGVSISRTVYDHVHKKLKFGYEFQGEHQVKNIAEPVRVYKVLTASEDAGKLIGEEPKVSAGKWIWPTVVIAAVIVSLIGYHLYQKMGGPEFEPASVEKMAYPLPDKPSIAVLAFDNMSGDPKQEFLTDGISEDIINALSKLDQVFVVARNSSFTYKGKAVKIQQVAEDLGVQYVLEGSVRTEGDRVRVTAQLIDALSGHHLFSERYDQQLTGIFALQDEIAVKVLTAVRIQLTDGDIARIQARGVSNVDAFFKLLEAYTLIQGINRENNTKARRLAEESLLLEPGSTRAYYILAVTHFLDFWLAPPKSRAQSNAKGIELAQKALELDPDNAPAHGLLGMLYVQIEQYDQAVEEAARGAYLDPNSVTALMFHGSTLMHASRYEEAAAVLQKALRLSPVNPPSQVLSNLAGSYRLLGKYEESVELSTRLLKEHPNHLFGHLGLTATYSEMGRLDDARAEARQVLRINPKFYLEGFRKTSRFKNPADLDRFFDALYKAGLPETPPLPLPEKPSIAVLSFDNMSGDPEQEYFSDGIAENIITALSKVGELFVIARNSSFTYKGMSVKVQQISRELGVRYVLEGSVQKSGDKVRITAQLIDAQNGQHLWAENYDRELKDIFEIQDEITMRIVNALRVELTEGETARIYTKKYKSLDVYLKQAKANSLYNKGTEEALMRYGLLTQEIIDAEPEFPVGYRARAYYHNALAAWGVSPSENYKKALALAQKALSIDASDAFSYIVLGLTYARKKEFEKALEFGKRSVELLPNNSLALSTYGSTLADAERFDEAISYQKQAIRLNPFPPYHYYYHLGRCYFFTRQYGDALKEFKKGLQRAPNAFILHAFLAITYVQLDRTDEARASAEKALEINPTISMSMLQSNWRYKTQEGMRVTMDAMRMAGFPE